jgi:hypothetical protein
MTALAALVGSLLIVIAIPLGLMVAPLALGVALVWYALRRVDRALERPSEAVA